MTRKSFLPVNKVPRNLLFTFVLLSIVMPLISVYGVYPKYRQQLIDSTERDAVLLGTHLAQTDIKPNVQSGKLLIDEDMIADLKMTAIDFNLAKIKIFDSSGKVIYSSEQGELGKTNQKPYFHDIVAKGGVFTKFVHESEKSLEGVNVKKSVVETYVPVLSDRQSGEFIGAYEIYYDVSGLERDLVKIFAISLLLPAFIMVIFLVLIYLVLSKLDSQMLEQEQITALLKERQNDLLIERDKQGVLFSKIEAAKIEWESTMDCVGDMIMLTDCNFTVKRCNKAVMDFCKLKFGDIIGKNCGKVLGSDDLMQRLTPGELVEYNHEVSGKWFAVNVYSVSAVGGLGQGNVVSLHDITDIKSMTSALNKKNDEIKLYSDKLQIALGKISGLIQQVVEDGSFGAYFDNKGLKRCYEVMECSKTECPCYGKEPVRCWQSAGTFCGGEVQGAFAQKYNSCVQCLNFKEATSDPVNMIGEQFNNMMHILETKNHELESTYAELKQAQSQMLQQEKMASIGQLAAGVAHEINNPMGFISSNLASLDKYTKRLNLFIDFQTSLIDKLHNEDAKEQLACQRQKEKMDFIQQDLGELIAESLDGCERVRKIVQDMKGFSRVDQADFELADLNECIESTFNIVRNELKYKAKVEKEYGELDHLECFPQQLNQVFMNLLVNAAQAIEVSGIIKVKTWQHDHSLYASVSDSGKGIAAENLERIFEPFFTSKDVGDGTGLGLSIVYDIITKNHNGEIVVESEEGKGTVFTIRLPLDLKLN